MEAATQFSNEGLGSQAICDRIRVPEGSPWEGNTWPVKVEQKLPRRPQDVVNARNRDYLPWNAKENKWSQLRREAMWATNDKDIEVGLLKVLELTSGLWVPGARHGATGFNTCFSGFHACFGQILPYYSAVPPFWNGNVYSLPFYFLNFTGAQS
jgi:hypothetical protein